MMNGPCMHVLISAAAELRGRLIWPSGDWAYAAEQNRFVVTLLHPRRRLVAKRAQNSSDMPVGSQPSGPVSSPEEGSPSRKRRKVRKGTQSCWECKRRKVRCTFATAAASTVCDGCRSRRTRCVGQEFEDVSTGAERRDRLSRVEVLVDGLADRIGAGAAEIPREGRRDRSRSGDSPVRGSESLVGAAQF